MSKPNLASELKGVSEKDRKQIEQAQEMLGPDPEEMGHIKNIFWGNVREDLVFPYPEAPADEVARCDQLLAALDDYLKNEHPHFEIDEKQEIPPHAIQRLFDLGVMGMIIPQEFGGGGYGVGSYNRVLHPHRRDMRLDRRDGVGAPVDWLRRTRAVRQRRAEEASFLPRMAKNTL